MIFRNRLIPPRYGTLGDVPPLVGDANDTVGLPPPLLGVRRALAGSRLSEEGDGDENFLLVAELPPPPLALDRLEDVERGVTGDRRRDLGVLSCSLPSACPAIACTETVKLISSSSSSSNSFRSSRPLTDCPVPLERGCVWDSSSELLPREGSSVAMMSVTTTSLPRISQLNLIGLQSGQKERM
jgi:hypothetical protein